MNKVSVIIPCYNKAPYVKEAIESVINQTFSDIEIIVVNDASTDNSAEIIKELEEKYEIQIEEVENLKTIKDAVDYVQSHKAN